MKWREHEGPRVKEKRPCAKGLKMANGMLLETAVREKRQGDSCHEGPFARRLRKGESWKQAAMCKGSGRVWGDGGSEC